MPILKEIIELSGAEWVGIQEGHKGNLLVLFNDPISHATLALAEGEVTVEAIQAAIEKSRKLFAEAKS